MKAIVLHAAKDLRVEDCAPEPLRPGHVRVKVEFGGICGSDLHYFNHGGFGHIRVREPIILGHEVSGRVVEAAQDADGMSVGDRVAVSPSRPCRACRFCDAGVFNQCLNMRFYGSAMPMPHIQGAFREELMAKASQCHVIAPDTPAELGAFAEPLAVVLHALNRAGDVAGKRVLITGGGPIGQLVLLAARHQGAAETVLTDPLGPARAMAERLGATQALDAMDADWTRPFEAEKGQFDVMFECSGAEPAFLQGLQVLRPRGTLVQVGLGGDIRLPQTLIVAKEIEMRGAFRFHEEFADAVTLINEGALDLRALLTDQFPVDDAVSAFTLAGDRARAMKVQLDFRG